MRSPDLPALALAMGASAAISGGRVPALAIFSACSRAAVMPPAAGAKRSTQARMAQQASMVARCALVRPVVSPTISARMAGTAEGGAPAGRVGPGIFPTGAAGAGSPAAACWDRWARSTLRWSGVSLGTMAESWYSQAWVLSSR